MSVAAMLDLGADENVLKKAIDSLPVKGYSIEITRVNKSGLDACDFNVILDVDNYDHNMEYLYGHHKMDTPHNHHHNHRGLKEIYDIIDSADITENAHNIAKKIFDVISKAEAKAHGVSVDKVHFHEVGAIDSIVDIISFAVCFDNLNIDNVIVPVLYEGNGFVRCQHGIMPVPVPAVLNIVMDNNLKLHKTEIDGELVTPTGAAIVAAIKTTDELPEKYKIIKSGMGAGKRQYECPGILRAMLIEE